MRSGSRNDGGKTPISSRTSVVLIRVQISCYTQLFFFSSHTSTRVCDLEPPLISYHFLPSNCNSVLITWGNFRFFIQFASRFDAINLRLIVSIRRPYTRAADTGTSCEGKIPNLTNATYYR